jgi:hypothetical protein
MHTHNASILRLGRERGRFAPSDYEALDRALAEQPKTLLGKLMRSGVKSLAELDSYARLVRDDPEAAERVRIVAALYGLPETS